jgi:hypothetical protein
MFQTGLEEQSRLLRFARAALLSPLLPRSMTSGRISTPAPGTASQSGLYASSGAATASADMRPTLPMWTPLTSASLRSPAPGRAEGPAIEASPTLILTATLDQLPACLRQKTALFCPDQPGQRRPDRPHKPGQGGPHQRPAERQNQRPSAEAFCAGRLTAGHDGSDRGRRRR